MGDTSTTYDGRNPRQTAQGTTRLTRGRAVRTVPTSLTDFYQRQGWTATGTTPAPETSNAPARNATTDAWRAYATAAGYATGSQADDMNRAELIELCD